MSSASTTSEKRRVKTAILMMNMGGPESDSVEDVERFLVELFKDRDIIKMPFQSFLGPLISRRRAANLKEKFDQIGGDPLPEWTRRQGLGITEALDRKSPASAPHKAYPCFRYCRPSIRESLEELEKDQAERVVVLSKYPQYSCSTTGSNLNDIARHCVEVKRHLSEKIPQKWSIIDRWPLHSAIVDVYAERIEQKLAEMNEELRSQIIILFSAHSIPMWMVDRGDDYTGEIGGTVQAVLSKLKLSNRYSLVWQSKVGPVKWQGPSIEEALAGYVENGHKHFLVVPIAFINEHIETLHELDIEYAVELRKRIPFETLARTATLNDHPKFLEGMAELVKEHLESKEVLSAQLRKRCPGCRKDNCKLTRQWFERLESASREFLD